MRGRLLLNKIVLAVFSSMMLLCADAQTGMFFNTESQLSSSFITQVYLDHDGFIWVTTRDGINRYDGYQFQVFKRENELGKTLARNYVVGMMQDRNGLFYFGMYGVVQTWDGSEFHDVTMYDLEGKPNSCYASCFVERANGDVLVGTSGLGVAKFTDAHTARQMGGPLSKVYTVNDLIEDRKGNLWLVTAGEGLICYDGRQAKRYLADRPDLTLSKLCEDKEGTIYVGTANAGMFRLVGDRFVHVPETGNIAVSELYCAKDGSIFIGYDGQGVGVYDPKTGKMTSNPFYSLQVDLSKSKVYSITEDRSGNIWFGLLQKGIFRQPIAPAGFHYMGYKLGTRNMIGSACVISLLYDSKGRTWVGTDKDGMYCFDTDDKLIRHYNKEIPSSVMTIAEDHDGRIWIGSYGEGGGWIDPATGQYHRLNFPKDPSLNIMDIEVDASGRLWLATMRQGLLTLMPNQPNNIRQYVRSATAETDRTQNCITNDYLSQVAVSPDGKRIYCATTMGVCCLDIASDSWITTFGTNCPNYGTPVRIAREYGGYVWIGTTDGLYRYDMKSRETRHFTMDDGLSANGISSIEQDQSGKLWIGTDHGLNCYDPKEGNFRNFFVDDGLQSDEFSDGASCLSANGTLFFGGTGGISWFKPQDVRGAKWEAKVQLTSFFVNGAPVSTATKSGGYLVTDTTIIASNHFELSHYDNSFAIRLSTLTYENADHITYLYSINGEPYIRMQSGDNELTFSHLPPGTYRFRVKAERNNIETPDREFTVTVHAPWYRSAWAYCLYFLLIAVGVWYYLESLRRKERDRLRLQEHIHAKELGEAKLRFFMNISHEIRTPLTLIITPLLSLMKDEKDPHRKGAYGTMKRNAERILHLVNQMMDLRKIDKGQMQMRMTETDLIGFVHDIYSLFEHQARAKNIALSFEHPDADLLPVWIDRQNFDKVIMNILSNAFKFTPAGGEIDIRVTHNNENVVIAVSDNGEKIPEDKLDKIFERFYQSTSTINGRNIGTGIGLDLTRSLVELHHGTITARNLKQGCEFVVTIPLGNGHLKPAEMVVEKDNVSSSLMTSDELMTSEIDELMAEVTMPAEPVKNSQRQTLVIAEDDDEIREYLVSELGQDYEVKACLDGLEALKEVLRVQPDLVISDIMMPKMDGNALCSKLKSNPSTHHIPVVMLTAKTRDEDKLEGLETGADAYIVKPFNMDILRRTVSNLIASHQRLRLKYGRNDQLEEQVDEVKLESPDEKLLARVMNAVNKHLADSELSVDMIADEVGISRVHLHRKMKELTGQTPHDFIRNIRLKRAAFLLASQGASVTEVMYACGFSNPASFSTLFKKFYGVSPRDYMREHEGE